MRIKVLFPLLLVGIFCLILSCASTPPELTAEHQNLIGTKWLAVASGTETMEFVDRYFFVTTNNSNGEVIRSRYTVKDNRIVVGNNLFSYMIRGDELYFANILIYKKI